MFQMAKCINKHLVGFVAKEEVEDEEGGSAGAGAGGKRKAAKAKPVKKPKKKAKKGGDGEGPKRSFPMERLSPELAAVVGKPEAPRNEVVKALWAHIKEHKLQDPRDGRQILCDDTLKQLFDGQERVSGFGMNKFLAPHFLGRV
jgi:upstream activation factor subunit UAF30